MAGVASVWDPVTDSRGVDREKTPKNSGKSQQKAPSRFFRKIREKIGDLGSTTERILINVDDVI
jgi:hypothetical protein